LGSGRTRNGCLSTRSWSKGLPFKRHTSRTEIANLTIVPAAPELAGAEVELVAVERREYQLQRSLSEVRERFDLIFLDCPPSLGLLTINGLSAADSVLIPVQCEYLALEGITQLIETLKRVKNALNPDLKVEGVLMTMFDERTNLSKQVVDDIRAFFKDSVYTTIIPRNIRLGEAPSFGKPFFLYDSRSKGAEAYFYLARELLRNEETALGKGLGSLIPDRSAADTVTRTENKVGHGTRTKEPTKPPKMSAADIERAAKGSRARDLGRKDTTSPKNDGRSSAVSHTADHGAIEGPLESIDREGSREIWSQGPSG
jgi:chromosome partitioning protein